MRRLMMAMMAMAMMVTSAAAAAPQSPRTRAQSLLTFLQTYQRQQPAQVLAALHRFDNEAHLLISLSPNLASDVYLRACQANPGIRFVISGTPMTCHQAAYDVQTALQWTPMQSLLQEVNIQRQQLINTQKCTLGLISKGVCRAAGNLRAQVAGMQHATAMQTIHNLDPNACTVGSDPNCRPIGR